jgi:hypothetical protein
VIDSQRIRTDPRRSLHHSAIGLAQQKLELLTVEGLPIQITDRRLRAAIAFSDKLKIGFELLGEANDLERF